MAIKYAIPLLPEQWALVIEALDYQARNEAGMSQWPDLFTAEDTEQHDLAREIEAEAQSFLPG